MGCGKINWSVRKLIILQPQAYVDDSVGSAGSKALVLAGFVSSAAGWAAFSEEWQAALDLEPKLDYFKMNEANLLIQQFSPDRGWTEVKRDDRLVALIRIIKKYVRNCSAPGFAVLADASN